MKLNYIKKSDSFIKEGWFSKDKLSVDTKLDKESICEFLDKNGIEYKLNKRPLDSSDNWKPIHLDKYLITINDPNSDEHIIIEIRSLGSLVTMRFYKPFSANIFALIDNDVHRDDNTGGKTLKDLINFISKNMPQLMSYNVMKKVNESTNNNNNSKGNMSLITDLCTAMCLINPTFLDNILDKGRRSRYTHNTTVFLNDLKNLVTGNNRLKLGKRGDKKFVEDEDSGKVNSYFNEYSQDFDMEKHFSKLGNARDIARNIQQNLITDYQLSDQSIKNVFWIAPNKENKEKEDIVIETSDGRQFPIVINSKMNVSKTQSFNKLMDLMLGQQADKLFTDQYLDSWDKLTQEWFKLVYENCKHELKIVIDQYIDATRGDSLAYFEFFGITILDPKYKHLGLYVSPLNKNYKDLSKLLTDIWKGGSEYMDNFEKVEKEWNELKKITLNSRIIEHLIVDSLNNLINDNEEVELDGDNYILSKDRVKMRLMKVLVNLLSVTDVSNYYCTKTDLYHIPTRQWFRDNYDDMSVEYDYHQRVSSEDNDSQFRIKLKLNDKLLLTMELFTGFSGGEMSGKLNTKMKIEYVSDWNTKIENGED
tara:strand:- start:99561 stop:101333 length:1773 start_codon:yes stop_codon:yes gene_type:complete